jgi:serine/threonine protein kinase
LADDIREVFPALAGIEQVEEDRHDPCEKAIPLPRQLGDFRLLREIGRGGMGVVYEAEQQSLGRRVALKVLTLSPTRDAQALERFRREARAAARLHHTNIVPVFEVGQEGDTCYYSMQFIQGQGLDQVIAELVRLRQTSPASRVCSRPPNRCSRAASPSHIY